MKPKDPTKNPDMKYETQVASQGQALRGGTGSFPTPAHPTPRFLSRKGAIMALIFIALSFLIAFVMGGLMLADKDSNKNNEQIACTDEAIICPDGSSVGRTGRACEFTACPSPTDAPISEWKTYDDNVLSFKYPKNEEIKFENDSISTTAYPPFNTLITYNDAQLKDTDKLKGCNEELEKDENGIEAEACIGNQGEYNPIKSVVISGKIGKDYHITYPILGGGPRIIKFDNPTIFIYADHPIFEEILPTLELK